MLWGRVTFERQPGTNKMVRREQPRSEWKECDAPELRIVSDEAWRRVREREKAIRASGTQLNSRPLVLQVVDQTQIQVDGHPSSFTALRLGDVIRASYEDRYGIKVTRSIDVRSKSPSGAGADRH